jgi:hypothetical protein
MSDRFIVNVVDVAKKVRRKLAQSRVVASTSLLVASRFVSTLHNRLLSLVISLLVTLSPLAAHTPSLFPMPSQRATEDSIPVDQGEPHLLLCGRSCQVE